MKLVSYENGQKSGFGVVVNGGIVELRERTGFASLRAFLASGNLDPARKLMSGTKADLSLDQVKLLPPIPDPAKIICVGLNYRDHVVETGKENTGQPMLFARFATSQVGHGSPMVAPRASDKFDFEGELAVVIGRAGRHISEANAVSHIAGYSCYNDGSIRDYQNHTSQFLPGKNFVGTGGFGPWLVTTDEMPDPSKFTLVTRLNGVEMQRSTGDLMIHSVKQIIAYISVFLPLEIGDVLVTGTPGGVGARRKPPLFMKAGDVIEVEIDTIGVLRNPVVAE